MKSNLFKFILSLEWCAQAFCFFFFYHPAVYSFVLEVNWNMLTKFIHACVWIRTLTQQWIDIRYYDILIYRYYSACIHIRSDFCLIHQHSSATYFFLFRSQFFIFRYFFWKFNHLSRRCFAIPDIILMLTRTMITTITVIQYVYVEIVIIRKDFFLFSFLVVYSVEVIGVSNIK